MDGMTGIIFAHGGAVVWLIVALSVLVVAVIVERLWRLLPLVGRFARVAEAHDRTWMDGGRAGARAAIDGDGAMGRVLLVAHAAPVASARTAAVDAAQREVGAIERGLGMLLAIAQVAPLLGLLGTVIGLIEAFRAASSADTLSPQLLAGGLYQALGSTVAGLVVAIAAYAAYAWIGALAGRLIDRLEHAATATAARLDRAGAAAPTTGEAP